MLATGQELKDIDYSIVVVHSNPSWVSDIWPATLSSSDRFYDLSFNETTNAYLEDERRVTFLMATADVHEAPEDLIGHLWEKSRRCPGLIELWNSSFSTTTMTASRGVKIVKNCHFQASDYHFKNTLWVLYFRLFNFSILCIVFQKYLILNRFYYHL